MHEPARIMTSDAEIEAAIQRARKNEKVERSAVKAEYLASNDRIRIHMNDGATHSIPRFLVQGLAEVRKKEKLSTIQILGHGTGLLWPLLDVSHSVDGLIKGVYGSQKWMNRLGSRAAAAIVSRKKNRSAKTGSGQWGRLVSRPGLHERHRDLNGGVREKSGNTSVGTLRKTYGQDFLSEWRNDAKLSTVRQETDMSLIEMVRQHRLRKKLPSPAHHA